MSWRRSTMSGRRLLVAGVVVVAPLVAVPAVLARVAAPVAVAAAPEAAPAPAAAATPTGTPVPRPAVTEARAGVDQPHSDTAAPTKRRARREVVDDRATAEARQVAADFAAAYATFRFDEAPAAAAARVAAWATPELAQELAANTGGAAGRAALVERQQVAEAQVESVTLQRVEGRDVDVLVVLAQKVSRAGGAPEARWPSYLLRVSLGADGWRVSALQP